MFGNFEQGPIRPPSEANSLLIRVTRNCPWNKCLFCPVYKNEKFSTREVAEVKSDISNMRKIIKAGKEPESVFLQDADNLVIPADDLAEIIGEIKNNFGNVSRITTYARSKTAAKKSVEELKKLSQAGLSRVHVGLETGHDPLLEYVKKGVTSAQQIEAGLKIKEAGLNLSEYVILGLGGKDLSRQHAIDTAKVLSEIDPDFIRVRTLGVRDGVPLVEKVRQNELTLANDLEILNELRLFLEHLDVKNSYFYSDHILNLLEEVSGKLPEDKPDMIRVIDDFFNLPEKDKKNFMVGRRLGAYRFLHDLMDQGLYEKVERAVKEIEEKGKKPEELICDYGGRYI